MITKNKIELKYFIKTEFKKGNLITFNNENTNFQNLYILELSFRNEAKNSWANGFNISFNGMFLTFKTFDSFFKKVNKLIQDFNLKLTEVEF